MEAVENKSEENVGFKKTRCTGMDGKTVGRVQQPLPGSG